MIAKIKCVKLICDNCREHYCDEHTGFSIYVTESDVHEAADSDGWYVHGDDDKHYCPNCYKIDDDDNVIVLNQKQ